MSTIVKTTLFAVLGVLFSFVCIGENKTVNKVLYALVATGMIVLSFIGDRL